MSPTGDLQQHFITWALRGKAPETSPIVLGRRRVFVLPTLAGLAYSAALTLMLIGAINYNLSLGYATVFLLSGLGVIAIFHTFRNLAYLHIAPCRAPPVFAGGKAHFCLLLTNLRALPRLAIRLKLPLQAETEIDVPEDSGIEAILELPAPRRGWLILPRVKISTSYPLGLIRAWAYVAPKMRCLVYPTPAKQAPALPMGPGEDGGNSGGNAGMEDFAGLRGHQAADPLRRVAWKAAARREDAPLLSKLFAGAAAQTLWLEWDALPARLDIEARLSLLTRWVCDADRADLSWGLRLPDKTIPPARGDEHCHACLKALALYGRD